MAIIAQYAEKVIPFFMKSKDGSGGIKGLARSMPTSMALDSVAKKLGKTMKYIFIFGYRREPLHTSRRRSKKPEGVSAFSHCSVVPGVLHCAT